MKNIWSFLPLSALLFSFEVLFCAEPKRPDNYISDYKHTDLPIARLNEFVIGKSTLQDVYSVFGSNENDRMTFNRQALPKTYRAKNYEVHRIIRYDEDSFDRKSYGAITETTWKETITVTFFFDRQDILLFHTIRHRLKDRNGQLNSGQFHNIQGDPDELWPDSVCDSIFHKIYETKKGDPHLYADDKYFKKCVWYKKLNADIKSGLIK